MRSARRRRIESFLLGQSLLLTAFAQQYLGVSDYFL